MNRKLCLALAGTLASLATTGTLRAETLLGNNYVGGSFGITHYGDDETRDILGNGYGVTGFGNINLHPNLDLNLDVSYAWASGDDAGFEYDAYGYGTSAALTYFLRPTDILNPYFTANIEIAKVTAEVSGFELTAKETETLVGFGAGAGIQIEATDLLLIDLELQYFDQEDNDPDIYASAGAGYWFNHHIFSGVSGTYEFDDGDVIGEIAFIVKL